MSFGVTATVFSLFLRFDSRFLLRILSADDNAWVRIPTVQEVDEYRSTFSEKYSILTEFTVLLMDSSCTWSNQVILLYITCFHNGWTHDHYVWNIFLVSPSGLIIACALNSPGAKHESQIAEWSEVYRKL